MNKIKAPLTPNLNPEDEILKTYETDPDFRHERFEMVRGLVSEYAETVKEKVRPDFVEHAERTVKLLGTFTDGLFPEPAYHAAMLHDVAQGLDSEDELVAHAAAKALDTYFSSVDEKEAEYVSRLLGDMKTIGEGAASYRKTFRQNKKKLSDEEKDILANGTQKQKIPARLWEVYEPRIRLRKMKKIAKHTNFEAAMILVAEKIDHLQHPASDNESKLIRDIMEAETYFGPLCEFWGFDAMGAMTLKAAATRRRYEKLGRREALEKGEELHEKAVKFGGPKQVVRQLFGLYREPTNFEISEPDGTEHDSVATFVDLNTFTNDRRGDPVAMRIVARIKASASLAKKWYESYQDEPDKQPMDAIGLTAISKNINSLTEQFCATLDAVNKQREASKLVLEASGSHEKGIYVQGGKKFRESIQRALKGHPLEDFVEIEPTNQAFQVAKFMCHMENERGDKTTVEMQFLTQLDRMKARVGETAHALREMAKDGHPKKWWKKRVRWIRQITERKEKINSLSLMTNEHSVSRGEELRAKVSEKLNRQIGETALTGVVLQ